MNFETITDKLDFSLRSRISEAVSVEKQRIAKEKAFTAKALDPITRDIEKYQSAINDANHKKDDLTNTLSSLTGWFQKKERDSVEREISRLDDVIAYNERMLQSLLDSTHLKSIDTYKHLKSEADDWQKEYAREQLFQSIVQGDQNWRTTFDEVKSAVMHLSDEDFMSLAPTIADLFDAAKDKVTAQDLIAYSKREQLYIEISGLEQELSIAERERKIKKAGNDRYQER